MLSSITVSTYILLLILSSAIGIVVGIVGHLLLDLYRSRRGAGESSPPEEPSPSPRGGLPLSEITWEEALELDATGGWNMLPARTSTKFDPTVRWEQGMGFNDDDEDCYDPCLYSQNLGSSDEPCPRFGDCQGCDHCDEDYPEEQEWVPPYSSDSCPMC